MKKDTLVYLIANIINASIPFILLPVLTRLLTVEEYGKIAMFHLLITFLSGYIGWNSTGASTRFYYSTDNNLNVSKYNINCIFIFFISLLLILPFFVIFDTRLASELNIEKKWIYYAIVIASSNYFVQFLLCQFQVRKEVVRYAIIQISRSLFNLSMVLILIDSEIIYLINLEVRPLSQLIIAVVFFVIVFIILIKNEFIKSIKICKVLVFDIIKFGVPLLPHSLGVVAISIADRYMINKDLGSDMAGIYMVGFQLSLIFSVLFNSINKAYIPWLYKNLKNFNNTDFRIIVRNTYYYFLLLIVLFMFFSLFAESLLVYIATEIYREAAFAFIILSLGQIFIGMYHVLGNYLMYYKKTAYMSNITVISGLIGLSSILYLIPLFGIEGAAFGFLISCSFRLMLTWFFCFHLIKDIPWILDSGKINNV